MKVRSKERFTAEQWFSHEKPIKGVRRVDSVLWRNECPFCKGAQEDHGQVETYEHTRIICSGDWVVTKVVTGAQEVLRPFRFHERFEEAAEEDDKALLESILETQRRINAEHEEFTEDKARRKRDFVQFCVDCQKYNADAPSLLGGREEACSDFVPKKEEE